MSRRLGWMKRREYLNCQEKPFYHTALLRKVVRKNMPPTIPKGNMGYDQYTVPVTLWLSYLLLLPSFTTRKHKFLL